MLIAGPADAADLGTIRVGVLQFGTVNWELDVIRHHGLDEAQGFTLEVQPFASGQATNVALQGKAVDAIVDDWLWVSRQRSAGQDLVFAVPYSSAVGAVMVPADSGIEDLIGLKGKKLGIAGGPIDKSWLLLQALAAQRHDLDLTQAVEKVFGAPPLLQEKLITGELDAVLNYWHYAARLEAKGYRRLLSVAEAIRHLGGAGEVPQLGYVMWGTFADAHPELVEAFARASREAKRMLLESDQEWQRLRPIIKAEDEATLAALRSRYREGVPRSWGPDEWKRADVLYGILAEIGGEALVGDARQLAEGTFWPGVTF
jgi:NitT/TauT family transport system substrate-binding protein